jgi:hypothetical protein
MDNDTLTQPKAKTGCPWNLQEPVPANLKPVGNRKNAEHISSKRFAPADVSDDLGLLTHLAGSWAGEGFNLIARPAFNFGTDLFLQVNRTRETLKFDPIGSPIPNRGFEQKDITLHGLTYLQKISDLATGGALHIEPGIWVRQPNTKAPAESAPSDAEIVCRMASIPHGNTVLAQGLAEHFTGPPTLQIPGKPFHGSSFYAFNSTPIGAPPTVPATAAPVFSATGSSQKQTAAVNALTVFNEYNLAVAEGATNPRTNPLLGITQAVIDDHSLIAERHQQPSRRRIYLRGHGAEYRHRADGGFLPVQEQCAQDRSAGVQRRAGKYSVPRRSQPPNGNAQTAVLRDVLSQSDAFAVAVRW